MSDPFSIAVGVMAVATLAYSSCETLNNMIKGYQKAPAMLSDLQRDLETVQTSLQSLTGALNGVPNSALSPNQETCLADLGPAIQQCKATCDKFRAKLSQLCSHSGPDHVNWFDRARLHLNESDIALFKTALERHKQTLDIAVGVATFQTVRQNRNVLQSLETKIATSISEFTGQMEGLQLAVKSLSQSNVDIKKEDVGLVVKVLNEHDIMLKQCLKICESGLKETTMATGTSVKFAEVFGKAQMWIGNMGYDGNIYPGAPPVNVDRMVAHDEARQGAGNMSKDVAKGFWNQSTS